MTHENQDDDLIYTVVVNHEEQYSIWPADRPIPLGWTSIGKSGRKDECLATIESVWTDMRPLSLRRRAKEAENPHAAKPTAIGGVDREECSPGPSLVERLSSGRHPVEAALRPEKTATVLKACIDHDQVRVRFLDTQGPTELGLTLDKAASDIRSADFEHATGAVHLEGDLTLDAVKVWCIVDLDLATLCGEGYLLRRGQ